MPIEMPRGLPFSVDTWTPNSKKKRHYFLTHAHKDHTTGILTHSSYPIHCTLLTKSLLLLYYPQIDESLFVCIEVGQSLVIDDPDGQFTVTAFDANHCPGAVMFLFEGNFGNILHTGDCRLTPECLQYLPEKYRSKSGKHPRCQLDYIFLDCTFGKFTQKLPSRHTAIRQIISCIWRHPSATMVYLTCDLLGQEDILTNVFQTFGSKIFVDKSANKECFGALSLTSPEILSQDPSSRFHLFNGFPKLYERAAVKLAEAQANKQPEPLIIRPSSQWYACEEENSETGSQRRLRYGEAMRDQFGVWHVCYSMHSSREELEWALQLLMPKRVVSTTPSCWAMELDYVKKHSFGTRLTSDDPLWMLLDISVEASSDKMSSVGGVNCSPVTEAPTQSSVESLSKSVEVFPSQFLSSSLPSKDPPMTLFGRARLGIYDFSIPPQKSGSTKDKSRKVVSEQKNKEKIVSSETDVNVKSAMQIGCTKDESPKVFSQQINRDGKALSETNSKMMSVKEEVRKISCSPIGSSKYFSENVRSLYRSMNVPVPRPLPSLVELMGANKRTKRMFEF